MKRKTPYIEAEGFETSNKRQARGLDLLSDGSSFNRADSPNSESDEDLSVSVGHGDDGGSTTPITTITSASSRKFPSDLKTIRCTYPSCPKTFNRPARLAAHLRSHTNDRPFHCSFTGCDKAYLEEKHLKQHIKGSHTLEREHVCPWPDCGKSFLTATRLRRHQAVHQGAERFRCRGYDGCDRSFRKHQTLDRHVRVDHLGQAAFLCFQIGCGAGFDSAGALKRHVDREHGELRFWCDECGKRDESQAEGACDDDGRERVGFTTLAQLQAHMRRSHVDCIFCEAHNFRSQAELDRHVEMRHSGRTVDDRRTVPCTWPGCQKRFTKRSNLNVHVRTAHEGFRFVCGETDMVDTPGIAFWNWTEEGCGSTFISKLKLEEHVLFVHLGKQRPVAKTAVYTDMIDGDLDGVTEHGEGNLVDFVSGVSEASKRNVMCTFPGCGARFIRNHDLSIHQQREHIEGLQYSVPSANAAATSNTLIDGDNDSTQHPEPPSSVLPASVFHGDFPLSSGRASVATTAATAQESPLPDLLQSGGDAHDGGEEYWLGPPLPDRFEVAGLQAGLLGCDVDPEWLRDEAEMRKLIDFDGAFGPA